MLKCGRGDSLIEMKRLDGGTVSAKEEAIARALELATAWVDERPCWRSAIMSPYLLSENVTPMLSIQQALP